VDSNGDGLGPLRSNAMVQMSVKEFKSWLQSGKTRTVPVANSGFGVRVGSKEFWKSDTISQSTGHLWYDQGRKRKKKKTKRRSSGPRWLELHA
jgi:hypothetical protein